MRVIPRMKGVVFHIPFDQCEAWVMLGSEAVCVGNPIQVEMGGLSALSALEVWSGVHLAHDCALHKSGTAHDREWKFE